MDIVVYDVLVDIDYKPVNHKELIKFCDNYSRKMTFITNTLGVVFRKTEVYETGKGLHIYHLVSADYELIPIDIVIIQFALGSDYKREVFNYRRARVWIEGEDIGEGWNTLYKYKYSCGKLVSCEKVTEMSRKIEETINRLYSTKLHKG